MTDTLAAADALNTAAAVISSRSENIAAMCRESDRMGIAIEMEPFISALRSNTAPDDGEQIKEHAYRLAEALRSSTERGLPGEILLARILDEEDLKMRLEEGTRSEMLERTAAYKRFDQMRLIEIAMDNHAFAEARERIDSFRPQADENESAMLDDMLREIRTNEHKQKKYALYLCGGALLILLVISLFNAFSRPDDTEEAATARPVMQMLTRPVAGLDNPMLSRAEIRYCKVFYAVLRTASNKIDVADKTLVQRYKEAVDDYSDRCSRYRYNPDDMAAIDLEMQTFDATSEAEKVVNAWKLRVGERGADGGPQTVP